MPTSIDILTTDRAHLSRDELKRYASGGLPASDQHGIELHLEQCPLCAEAVEGISLVPAAGAIDELQWDQHTPTDSNGKMIRGVLLAGVFLAGSWVAWQYGGDKDLPLDVGPDQPVIETTAVVALLSEEEEVLLVQEVNSAVELPAEELIGTPETIMEQVTTEVADDDEQGVIAELIDTMEPRDVVIERTIVKTGPNSTRPKRSSRQLIFLHDLKIVDPKELYPEDPRTKVKTRSIGADRENRFDANGASIDRGQEIQYLQLMDNALHDFSAKRYRGAVWELVPLLEAHPDDVNGLFYSGLCYYNLGLFNRAEKAFDKVQRHSIDSFHEPAAWYFALTIERSQGTQSTQALFQRIADEGGFYAEKARKKITDPAP